jgi:phosphonate ABC transporter permease subunit PhnE
MKKPKPSAWKSAGTGLAILLVLVVYAYGFEITKIDLEELRSEQRQLSITRVLRALARPEIVDYEREEQTVVAPVYVGCPADGTMPQVPVVETSGPYLSVIPTCAESGELVEVEGFGFFPRSTGPVRFVPGNDPANPVQLGRDTITTDADGNFRLQLELPDRPSDESQYIRATIRRNVGSPRFTQNARNTWDKIVETVFLALLATTIGTALAIPISFLAARNLMKSVRSPLAGVALSILGWVAGMGLGVLVIGQIAGLSKLLAATPLVNVAGVALSPAVLWLLARWAMPAEETKAPSRAMRLARAVSLLLAAALGFLALLQLAELTATASLAILPALGSFGFLASFLFQVSDILRVSAPLVAALASGGVLGSLLGGIGQLATERGSNAAAKVINVVTTAAAGAALLGILGWVIEALYQIGRPGLTLWWPLGIGAALGAGLAAALPAKATLPVGLVIYTITRTILNSLRSVEALLMAVVFAIAVGIGPFAGVMALGLHTIVSLAKLYSEQVESILPGPLEAVNATGADRLQTIMYAVVPQIVPPYISYTMYRWDINVRMSTIIGMVGGGGIGFLLLQNLNLLQYRAASTQMIAIAVVVSAMDYLSSVMREKYV